MKREIKKSVIVDNRKRQAKQQPPVNNQELSSSKKDRSRSRSREKKEVVVQKVDANSRRAILMRMKQKEEEEERNAVKEIKIEPMFAEEQPRHSLQQTRHQPTAPQQPIHKPTAPQPQEQDSDQDQIFPSAHSHHILKKPVYVAREVRDSVKQQEEQEQRRLQEEERKHKITRLNTKLILNETVRRSIMQMKAEGEQAQEESDSDSDNAEMPDDDDTKDTGMEYELWKIRELKRIRRDKEERQKFVVLQADVERRRRMTDEERLAENKRLGSDLTDNTQSTKYVFMQKYYHKGAFYQDTEDEIFKRDYNLPTPMELQDKSLLPAILQKRKNDFGRKGQSKYKHLTAEDTTNFDPKYRPDEGIRIAQQRKMGGYKGAFLNGKR